MNKVWICVLLVLTSPGLAAAPTAAESAITVVVTLELERPELSRVVAPTDYELAVGRRGRQSDRFSNKRILTADNRVVLRNFTATHELEFIVHSHLTAGWNCVAELFDHDGTVIRSWSIASDFCAVETTTWSKYSDNNAGRFLDRFKVPAELLVNAATLEIRVFPSLVGGGFYYRPYPVQTPLLRNPVRNEDFTIRADGDLDGDGTPNVVELLAEKDLNYFWESSSLRMWRDWDVDGDTIQDGLEFYDILDPTLGPADTDGDGRVDFLDLNADNPYNFDPPETRWDFFPDNHAAEGLADTDRDGVPNFRDWDNDNDGLFDELEGFIGQRPNVACKAPQPLPTYRPLVDNDPVRAQVWRLYSAFFLRQPEESGFDYWFEQRISGTGHNEIAAFFSASVEFNNRYGDLSDQGYVFLVYANVLCRVPDQIGFDYWNAQLQAGLSRGDLMLYFSEGTEYLRRTATSFPIVQ